MHVAQLRQADLNLLVVLAVLGEERNVSRAAVRLSLGQPAVSRCLQRARGMFHDDLLVRTNTGFEPTPFGQRLLRELEVILPKLDELLSGTSFDPNREEVTFRISSTDYATHVVCPRLGQDYLNGGGKAIFEFLPWSDAVFDAMEHGRLDLLLNADDGNAPSNFAREALFEEEFVCVVAREHAPSRPLTLKQYLSARHIEISTFGGVQSLPQQFLVKLGVKRQCSLRLPYFAAAIRAVAGTALVATVPRRIAAYEARNPALKVVGAPKELRGFKYQMVWHPRMKTDAAHVWLRATMREIGKQIAAEPPAHAPEAR